MASQAPAPSTRRRLRRPHTLKDLIVVFGPTTMLRVGLYFPTYRVCYDRLNGVFMLYECSGKRRPWRLVMQATEEQEHRIVDRIFKNCGDRVRYGLPVPVSRNRGGGH